MKNKYEFSITFKLEVEAMNVAEASLQMRKHVDEIHWMTESDDFKIDLTSVKSEDDGLIYVGGLEFYPEGTNLILE
jgi:hypothetical protein